jgi:NADPH:quinone reductase-like Zn-dependent oxidoreductase
MTADPTVLRDTMRALRLRQLGTPAEVLTDAHVPLPPVTADESIVRVDAADVPRMNQSGGVDLVLDMVAGASSK